MKKLIVMLIALNVCLSPKSNKCARRQLETNLLSLELGTYAVNTLVKFFGKEYTIYALKEELLTLFSNRKDATEKAEKGFNKLITIIEETENYGISVSITNWFHVLYFIK